MYLKVNMKIEQLVIVTINMLKELKARLRILIEN